MNGHALWKHRTVSYDSWGMAWWECGCGVFGLAKTKQGAQSAIRVHLRSIGGESPHLTAALRRTKYVRRLFRGKENS